ncbi:MAG TPA: penicillin acylase family protein [Terracidiphilus sp.]|jgi:penicillin amidase
MSIKMQLTIAFIFASLTVSLVAAAQDQHKNAGQVGTAPQTRQRLEVPGLKQPVEILKDRWGVAHIYAQNEADLFFAQGYNIASDRLFQLEMWRRQATGTIAEVLGSKELDRDIGNRLFTYRGDLTQELRWYHPHGAEIIQSFVNGINAYIAQTVTHPELLTPEFKILAIKPGLWTPAVVVSRFNGLVGNIDEELNMALAVRTLGVDKVKDIEYFQPVNPDLKMDPAIDASLLSKQILHLYDAFHTPIHFTADELSAGYRGNEQAASEVNAWTATPTPLDLSERLTAIGSNNWVVSGSRTPTGFPLVANDPHRVQGVPSLRYWVHLVAPGWDVIGGGEPSLPGVSIGHNEDGAWGLTVFGTDMEDLYVYDTNPDNPLQYRYDGGWETMKVIPQSIPVKGEAPVAVDLKYTRHGPVVFEDKVHHKAYVVRAAWLDTGAAPYLASLRMDQAHSWEEFEAACNYSRTPAENMVWGDVKGNIGYQAVGAAPRRPNWSGLVPVPGDGRYEWDGSLAIAALPHVLNPAKGYWNTSNNYLIPPHWPYDDALHYQWADAYRSESVAEVLDSGRQFTVADMAALQNNVLSIPARSLVPLLRDIPIDDAVSQQAATRLLSWNFIMDKDSVPAGIYEMWQRHLLDDMRQLLVPAEAQPFIGDVMMTQSVNLLIAPDGRFGADPTADRDAFLAKALSEAVADLTKRLGPDAEKWNLGAFHKAMIYHPFSPGLSSDQRTRFDVGDLPRSGDEYTIDSTGRHDNQTAGGSFKIIMDTADWDHSIGINNPGQSGDVESIHYRDLYQLWARGKYFPIFYSRPKVESVTEKAIDLSPVAAGR